MSKHHAICKSKTLDVPIIITSTTSEPIECNFGAQITSLANSNELSIKSINGNKFKLDKGLSLDSHCLKSQNSLSSSSTSNGMTSCSNSICSSNNSILHQNKSSQYLSPPSTVNSSAQSFNINADYEIYVPFQTKQTNGNDSNPNLNFLSSTSDH